MKATVGWNTLTAIITSLTEHQKQWNW